MNLLMSACLRSGLTDRRGAVFSHLVVGVECREHFGSRGRIQRARLKSNRGGFVLLEILMAIALFSTVSVAMVQALGQIADTSAVARREALMVRRLDSAITEAANRPKLESGTWETARDAYGISVATTVEEAEVRNREGKTLEGIWKVVVEVKWSDGAREERRTSETLVNEKLANRASEPAR